MPDTRKHRGAHPHDAELFRAENLPILRSAVEELSWLLSRGYTDASSLKLVGDRYALVERQRRAVMRSSCSDQARDGRNATRVTPGALADAAIDIDGFNLLTTIEAALSGGVLLLGRDGCLRDMASMHGNYRKVEETVPALEAIGEVLTEFGVDSARWLFDRPVSNSGRLSTIVRELAALRDWNWSVELVDDPDPILAESASIVVTADSGILDLCDRHFNLARAVVERRLPEVEPVDLG